MNAPVTQSSVDTTQPISSIKTHPISPCTSPMQYRAIGLIKGIYAPEEEGFNKGELTTSDGQKFTTFLLGRVVSLIKNHIDLTQEHLWVVYPRLQQTKKEDGQDPEENIIFQVMGIWEPDKLYSDQDLPPGEDPAPIEEVKEGFFSVRGEVIFHNAEAQNIIVKIRQAPKKKGDKPKFFKLKLKGTLEGKTLGHFWDIEAHFSQGQFMVEQAINIGQIPRRKKKFSKRPQGKGKGKFNRPRGNGDGVASSSRATSPKPLAFERPKPVKKPKLDG